MAILSFSVSLSAQRKGRLPVSQSSEESPACMFLFCLFIGHGPPQTSTDKTYF